MLAHLTFLKFLLLEFRISANIEKIELLTYVISKTKYFQYLVQRAVIPLSK